MSTYKWAEWFGVSVFSVYPIVDYKVSADSMCQQIRNAARSYNKRVNITVSPQGVIRVKVGVFDVNSS